jgi:hypothetical protein
MELSVDRVDMNIRNSLTGFITALTWWFTPVAFQESPWRWFLFFRLARDADCG